MVGCCYLCGLGGPPPSPRRNKALAASKILSHLLRNRIKHAEPCKLGVKGIEAVSTNLPPVTNHIDPGLKPLHLTSENFDAALSSNKPVLVDFWATWCPPCLALAPTIQNLAETTQGKAIIAKLDVDEARDIAMEYAIQSIPTMVIFKNGKEVDRLVGLQSKEAIIRRLALASA